MGVDIIEYLTMLDQPVVLVDQESYQKRNLCFHRACQWKIVKM